MNRDLGHELLLVHNFSASPERLFRAWIDEEMMAQWWGPKGWSNPVCELDAYPNGSIRIDMQSPEGTVFSLKGYFQRIIMPEELVFTATAFENGSGRPQLEVLNTAIFIGGKNTTQLTLHAIVLRSTPDLESSLNGMEETWNESLNKLQKLLANKTS